MRKFTTWQQALPDLLPSENIHNLNSRQQYTLSSEHMLIVLSGKARLFAYCPELQDPFLIDTLRSGKWLSNARPPLYLTLQAQQPTKFLCLHQQHIAALCHSNTDFTNELTAHIRSQQQLILQRLCWQKLNICARVDALLAQLFSDQPIIDLSHEELAMMLGTSRETVSRSLYTLEKQGRINLGQRCIKKITV